MGSLRQASRTSLRRSSDHRKHGNRTASLRKSTSRLPAISLASSRRILLSLQTSALTLSRLLAPRRAERSKYAALLRFRLLKDLVEFEHNQSSRRVVET